MRFELTRLLTAATVLVGILVLTACDTEGPKFADGESTAMIEGLLELGEDNQTHFQALTQTGTVSIQATEFTVRDPVTDEILENRTLGVSVGQPDPEDESRCRVTFSKTLEVGESFSVYGQQNIICMVVFRGPDPNEESRVRYLLTLSGAFT